MPYDFYNHNKDPQNGLYRTENPTYRKLTEIKQKLYKPPEFKDPLKTFQPIKQEYKEYKGHVVIPKVTADPLRAYKFERPWENYDPLTGKHLGKKQKVAKPKPKNPKPPSPKKDNPKPVTPKPRTPKPVTPKPGRPKKYFPNGVGSTKGTIARQIRIQQDLAFV